MITVSEHATTDWQIAAPMKTNKTELVALSELGRIERPTNDNIISIHVMMSTMTRGKIHNVLCSRQSSLNRPQSANSFEKPIWYNTMAIRRPESDENSVCWILIRLKIPWDSHIKFGTLLQLLMGFFDRVWKWIRAFKVLAMDSRQPDTDHYTDTFFLIQVNRVHTFTIKTLMSDALFLKNTCFVYSSNYLTILLYIYAQW